MKNKIKFAFLAQEDMTLRNCRVTFEQEKIGVMADSYLSFDKYDYIPIDIEDIELIEMFDIHFENEKYFDVSIFDSILNIDKKNILFMYNDQIIFEKFCKKYNLKYKK